MTGKDIIAARLPVRRGLDENEAAIYFYDAAPSHWL